MVILSQHCLCKQVTPFDLKFTLIMKDNLLRIQIPCFIFLLHPRNHSLNQHSLLSALNLWNRKETSPASHALKAQVIFISSMLPSSKLQYSCCIISQLQLEGGELWLPHPKPIPEGLKPCLLWNLNNELITVLEHLGRKSRHPIRDMLSQASLCSLRDAKTVARKGKWEPASGGRIYSVILNFQDELSGQNKDSLHLFT